MKINDALIGLFFLAIAIFAFSHAGTFKTMPGVPYGPGVFPRIIAGMMGLGGVLLIFSGFKTLKTKPLVQLDDWARNRRSYILFAAIAGSFIFYIFFAETVGFLLTSFLLLTALMTLTRGLQRVVSSLVIATVFSAVIFFLFGQVLRVPLPIGILEKLILGYS